MTRHIHLRIRRSEGLTDFRVQVGDGGSVLDALEAAWRLDPSLLFRHSCHHGSCGTCGMRINGREALACLTPVAGVTRGGRAVTLEPLHNLPLMGDLLVDLGPIARGIHQMGLAVVRESDHHAGLHGPPPLQYENCIECGLCVSACPIASSDTRFLGPAVLAAGGRVLEELCPPKGTAAMQLVYGEHGVWRCHSAFECSEVCPAQVDPAQKILGVRGATFTRLGRRMRE